MAVAGGIQSLGSVVVQDNLKFVVPDFQRNYAWEEEQIDALLEDLSYGAQSHQSHFIGSLIVQIDPAQPRVASVIDGQQRLTTIFMIVACLRDYVVHLGEQELKLEGQPSKNVLEKLNDFLFSHDEITFELRDRFEAHPMIAEMFSTQILASPLPNRPPLPARHHKFSQELRDAHKRIKRWPSEQFEIVDKERKLAEEDSLSNQEKLAWILRVLEVLRMKIKLLQISTQDEAESFDIFMSLNSTGKNLGAADLVKSHMFSKLTSGLSTAERSKKNQELTERWRGVLTNLDKGDIDQFLRHYLLSRQAERSVKEKDIFPTFREMLDPKTSGNEGKNILELTELNLERIIEASIVYEELLSCNALDSFQGKRALRTLLEIGSAYRILLMRVFADGSGFSAKEQERITEKVEAFNLRWVLTGGNGQLLENFYQKLANNKLETDASYSANEIIEELNARMADDDEVMVKFKTEAKSAKQTKLILFRIEQELGLDEAYDPKDVHLEQVAPLKGAPGWLSWVKKLFPGEPDAMDLEYETTVSQWGNLTLVEKPLPAKIKGAEFRKKADGHEEYEGYKRSKFLITQGLSDIEDWNRFSIRERNQWIGDCVLGIWPASGPSTKPKAFSYSVAEESKFIED
jgi:uncharacterized protein with ParB-like and HNH nuclease domain